MDVMTAMSPSVSAKDFVIAAARASAAMRPAFTLSVAKNEVIALVSAADSRPMILTLLAASSIGFPSAANCVGAMTIAAGFDATAVSSMLIWPLTSFSDCAPSSTTFTPRSCPALRAPASTACQWGDVISLTMTGTVGFVWALADGPNPRPATIPAATTSFFMVILLYWRPLPSLNWG